MATGRGIVLEQRVDQFCAFRCGEFLFYGPCQLHRLAITASEGICPVLSFGASAGLGAVLLFGLATSVHAQFTCTTNSGAITITGYTGTNTVLAIPGTIDGLPVTDIGTSAFV